MAQGLQVMEIVSYRYIQLGQQDKCTKHVSEMQPPFLHIISQFQLLYAGAHDVNHHAILT